MPTEQSIFSTPCEDGTVQNSNLSFSQNVSCGTTSELPDINFTDSDGITTVVPSMEDLICTPQTIASGIISDGTNYGIPFFELEKSVDGHNFRFRGITKGYTNGVNYFDVNGLPTTKALAFPEDLCCDYSTLDVNENFVMYSLNLTMPLSIHSTAITNAQAVGTLSFPNGFDLVTIPMVNRLFLDTAVGFLAFKPFDSTTGVWVWTKTDGGSAVLAYSMRANQTTSTVNKSAASTTRPLAYRITNIAEL